MHKHASKSFIIVKNFFIVIYGFRSHEIACKDQYHELWFISSLIIQCSFKKENFFENIFEGLNVY